jgi:hypothetical protein
MLLYNWKKIYRKSGGSSKRILLILESMLQREMPYNRFDPIYKYYYEDFSGDSFLVKPRKLMANKYKWKDKEIATYLGLASFRNLGEYYATGKLTLDLSHSPIGKDAINNNRLLRIEDNNIHFYYEDYTGENKLWQV